MAGFENEKVTAAERAQNKKEFVEASFLLALWSILVMNEGALRFIRHGMPGAPGLTSDGVRFAAKFLGALFEVIFGLFGFIVGIAGGIFDVFDKTLMYALLGVQTILGWYTFISYVFVIPSFAIANNKVTAAGLDPATSRAIGVFGILTSLAWCLALQGGQFVFICRMFAFAGNSDFLKQRSGAKMRSIAWNLVYAFAGFWALVTACVIVNKTGGTWTTKPPFVAPPNVGRLPYFLLLTSLLMTVWPFVGIALSVTGKWGAVRRYSLASCFVWILVYINYTLLQFGFMAGNPAEPGNVGVGAGMHNHLTMMLAFLPCYFMNKAAVEAMATTTSTPQEV